MLPANADQYCDKLFEQYNVFKKECSPARININNCCDLTVFPHNKVPSNVYQMNCKCGGRFTTADVYCDMSTDYGGWIVIQRNKMNSPVDFNRNWTDYEEGFGNLTTEFWYGLSAMHCLTQTGQWEMRVDYQKIDKSWSYLHYDQFSVGSASEEYPLTIGGFTGMGNDLFALHPLTGMKFSTPDNDNDDSANHNCATIFSSGWWYSHCRLVNANSQPPYVRSDVLFIEIKIRSKYCFA